VLVTGLSFREQASHTGAFLGAVKIGSVYRRAPAHGHNPDPWWNWTCKLPGLVESTGVAGDEQGARDGLARFVAQWLDRADLAPR
jgi:hypothetical protein